jgi:hypothetical protein
MPFVQACSGQAVKLTTHLQLMPRLIRGSVSEWGGARLIKHRDNFAYVLQVMSCSKWQINKNMDGSVSRLSLAYYAKTVRWSRIE